LISLPCLPPISTSTDNARLRDCAAWNVKRMILGL
jgi:hypothetical protein